MRGPLVALLVAAVAVACGGPSPAEDAGAGPMDASAPGSDAAVDGAVDGAVDAGGDDAGSPTPRRVLFVGNSYTYFNDLPRVVASIAEASGAPLVVESITEGGATLGSHWSATGARERIEAGGLDAVVMQGQSLEATGGGGEFLAVAELFAGAIDGAGAEGVWFATWARREGDPFLGPGGPAEMARQIQDNYARAARTADDRLARVGAAWELARLELPAVTLHTADGSHPTAEGSLLAACVIARSITGSDPVLPDPVPLGVADDTARALCALAPRVACPGADCCVRGEGFCDGACVDVRFSTDHCGACGNACAPDDPCRLGECGCPAGLTGCDGRCLDLQTDASSCGACDVSCEGGAVCGAGTCACQQTTVQPVTYEELGMLEPGCGLFTPPESSTCPTAAHRHCAAQACFDSGFGPPAGHSPRIEAVACVAGDVQRTTFTALSAFDAGCDGVAERRGLACAAAIHARCVAGGAASGFGPVEDTGDDVTVTCLPSATVVTTTLTELQLHASRCVPDPVACGIAAWGLCEGRGHPGGFGPIRVSGGEADVVCFDL